jgi:hypothetical protein
LVGGNIVDGAKLNNTTKLFGCLDPLSMHSFTMAARWRIDFDQPYELGVEDGFLEVLIIKSHYSGALVHVGRIKRTTSFIVFGINIHLFLFPGTSFDIFITRVATFGRIFGAAALFWIGVLYLISNFSGADEMNKQEQNFQKFKHLIFF